MTHSHSQYLKMIYKYAKKNNWLAFYVEVALVASATMGWTIRIVSNAMVLAISISAFLAGNVTDCFTRGTEKKLQISRNTLLISITTVELTIFFKKKKRNVAYGQWHTDSGQFGG